MLDVAAAIAAAEGRRPCVVGVPVGIPHNVGHLALKFQLVDSLSLCRDGLLKLVLLELGNIRSANLNGEEISNAECGRVLNALYGAYLDLADWTIHTGLSKSAASVNESLTKAFAL